MSLIPLRVKDDCSDFTVRIILLTPLPLFVGPQVSLARHLAARGFDTWVVEVRGNGLTKRVTSSGEVESEVQIELQSLESILPSLRNFGESEWAKRLNVNVQVGS